MPLTAAQVRKIVREEIASLRAKEEAASAKRAEAMQRALCAAWSAPRTAEGKAKRSEKEGISLPRYAVTILPKRKPRARK